jgi:squalene-hopene/tetraprenyl-beta-curcumene cyclase
MVRLIFIRSAFFLVVLTFICCFVNAAETKGLDASVKSGLEYLRKVQSNDGSFSSKTGPGVTALVLTAAIRNGAGVDDPMVAKGLKFIESLVQKDGGIYTSESTHKNYETCLSIVCLQEANKDGRYKKTIAAADKFIKGEQWDAGEGKKPADVEFGGAGYGGKKRPDLSNTAFLVEALKAAGNGPEDENMKNALLFISRCQNLESEHNTTAFANKVNDGGFYYTVANGGESFAGKSPEGGLRSYASMTYAGLKSMIYAGLKADDPRVKAAKTWIAKNYDLKSNPGMNQDGLYYFYNTFAKTMHALGEKKFKDDAGIEHDWRAELTEAVTSRQKADGSWTNDNSKRWMETDPNLVTAYALMSLSYCK